MVSWDFIEEALIRYGFPCSFVQLIMTCITSTNFFVKVNEEGHGYFEGIRGLRQEDPIPPPLLFVRVMGYLSRTMQRISELPDFMFYLMCKRLKLTHLVFVDDLMIFCKRDKRSIQRVIEVLDHFSTVTGLITNADKSNIVKYKKRLLL